jgi:hypothetical protein
VYFWEWDFVRAYEWAKEYKGEKEASVVGAAIEVGDCLDLTTLRGTVAVEAAFKDFEAAMKQSGEPLPENKDPKTTRIPLVTCLFGSSIELLSRIYRTV